MILRLAKTVCCLCRIVIVRTTANLSWFGLGSYCKPMIPIAKSKTTPVDIFIFCNLNYYCSCYRYNLRSVKNVFFSVNQLQCQVDLKLDNMLNQKRKIIDCRRWSSVFAANGIFLIQSALVIEDCFLLSAVEVVPVR